MYDISNYRFEYYLQTGKSVSNNHFGLHTWFSVS